MNFLLTLKFGKILLISIVIFIILDLIWLGFLAKNLYQEQLGFIARQKNGQISFILSVGLITQAIIALGLAVIISTTLQVSPSLVSAVLMGAFTGFVIYATYDLTSLSFVEGWPIKVTIIDILWGTTQGTLAGFYLYYLWQWL